MQIDYQVWQNTENQCRGLVKNGLWDKIYSETFSGAFQLVWVLIANILAPFFGGYETAALEAWYNYYEPMSNLVTMSTYAITKECYGPDTKVAFG
jgi:hypothetical protein